MPPVTSALVMLAIAAAQPREAAFPDDPMTVVDAKRHLGAKGDGIADDTDALQRGLDISCGIEPLPGGAKKTCVLFIPNGTYRVTRTLVVKTGVGPWVYGESRDGVVLRLADGAKDSKSVLRTHPRDEKGGSADWFMRTFHNFTVDAGNNPHVDGIRYCSTNTGILRNVRVVGNGKVGINMGFIDQSSPKLLQDAVVEGFETGVVAQWSWGETISRVTLRNCRKEGLFVTGNAVGVEDLVVENAPVAVRCTIPNNWGWWGGVIALVGGRFTGTDKSMPAIVNEGVLYARNVKTRGFAMAIKSSTPGGDVATEDVSEYVSHDVRMLFDAAPTAIKLPIKPEPKVPFEPDAANWVCANEFGAVYGDNKDDTEAFQRAFDAAAAAGKTTVYLRGIGGGDPNWYTLNGEVRVRGSVRHVIGLGFGRVIAGEGGRFVVDDESASVVKFESIQAFGGRPPVVENRSMSKTLVVENCDMRVVGTGTGEIFVTNCASSVHLKSKGARLWARQLNPEGSSDEGLIRNDGGDLWALGVKHEGAGVRASTTSGGRTELFGIFNYGPGIPGNDRRPMYDIQDASLSVMGLREIVFGGGAWPVKVRERRGGQTRILGADKEPGWTGWALYSGYVIQDSTPPGEVSGLVAKAEGPFSARLTWRPASDAESGVVLYEIHRGDRKIGTTRDCAFVESGLEEATSYTWRVTAVNGAGLRSKGLSTTATTAPDTTPPAIISAYALAEPTKVFVRFTKPVEDAARDSAGWTVEPGAKIESAALDESRTLVTLVVSPLEGGRTYTVKPPPGLKDRCKKPNALAANSQVSFTYRADGDGLSVTWFAQRDLRGRSFTRVDRTVAYDLDRSSPADGWPRENVSARWTGRLWAPVAGAYQLIVKSDDGARLWIDGTQVIDDWTDRGTTDSVARVELKAGFHDVKIEYYQGTGGACVYFDWVPPGGARSTVPREFLHSR